MQHSRRTFLRASGLSALSFTGTAFHPMFAGQTPIPWSIGTAVADITPPLEVGILMSSGRRQWAPFTGVRLPLLAHVAVIASGQRRVALVSLDLIGLAAKSVGGRAAYKARIAKAAEGSIAPADLLLACTHTHSGPESIALSDLDQTPPFAKWAAEMAQRTGRAIREAANRLEPARLVAGQKEVPGLAMNRRIRTTRGIRSVRTAVEGVLGPEGPVDHRVRVLAFIAANDQPRAILVGATAHPVYEMCIPLVSPDYPGEMVRAVQQRWPHAEVLFFQGAAGNINCPKVSTGADDAREHGRRLAQAVVEILGQPRPVDGHELRLVQQELQLPARDLSGKPQAEPLSAPVAALRLGNAAIAFLPGEPFLEIALAIQQTSPWSPTLVAGYAEDYIGYLPTDRALEAGGYETGPGRWSRAGRGSAAMVQEAVAAMLKSLKRSED